MGQDIGQENRMPKAKNVLVILGEAFEDTEVERFRLGLARTRRTT